jgi:hypothetical protein
VEKKIVLLKDLTPETVFPVVDLVKSEGERLGCATTSLVNFVMLTGVFDHLGFSNVSEMALYYELLLEKNEFDGVEPKKFFGVIDELMPTLPLEKYVLRAETALYDDILYLLANDFVGPICSNVKDGGGHSDVFFRGEDGNVYYNAIQVNVEELAELLFSDKPNMILLARNLEHYPRLFMRKRELANLKFKIEDRYMLSEDEIFYAENDLLAIFDKYPTREIPTIVKEKEYLLKRLGLIHEQTIIVD